MKSMKDPGRVAGFLYLLLVVFGPFSMIFVPFTLIVPGDAATTASNILASEGLFRMAMISGALVFLIEIGLLVVLYELLKPVNQMLALVATFSRLAMAVIQGINLLNYFAVLLLLSGVDYLSVFESDQLNALALLFLNVHDSVVLIWELFFGFHLLVLGYLIFKSGYLPRILGILLVCASLGYLIAGFGNMLVPNYKEMFEWLVLMLTVIPELALTLWLLIKGANPSKMQSVTTPALAIT